MKRIHISILILALAAASACNKYVDTPEPKNELPSGLAFSDDKTATASMVGLYSNMNAFNYYYANVLMSYLSGMQADEMAYLSAFASYDVFRLNNLLPNSQYVQSMWRDQYTFIYHANAVIEGVTASPNISAGVRDQLLGEAYFMRAFLHFYLVNMYGNIPLILTTNTTENNVKPQTPATEVYKQIISDLTEAKKRLADNYQSANRVRPNKAVATALLARVYLYTKQWSAAEAEATLVLQDGKYALLKDLNTVFLANSREALWQLMPVNVSGGRNTWEGFTTVPASATGLPLFRLDTTNLIKKFEAGDKRLANWAGTRTTTTGATIYFPYKYKVRTSTATTLSEFSMVLRIAEQYLIRAEARIQQDKLSDGRSDLDSIRVRAGLGVLPASLDKAALLLATEQERKVELFAEWGHRWFDLKRTGRSTAVLGPIKGTNWQATDTLYPIPSDAIRTNLNLDQNDGYK
ncbi:RagB/SusD family nutrient uptake outer membrane protein [Paraflavitalea pollutisoli]|uniref:RagB/SusD family nutrient uptake outer membrane protein n=1 Tax=Paraflavitalea pollutisoli TaxID=3034143 RepID=UPI0023EB6F01|nr:RagB/SusD family nutrient uptake outer membrane protein [Paraflavitalea sp. H1-2-19X]